MTPACLNHSGLATLAIVLAGLSQSVRSATPGEILRADRAEIVRIVSQADDVAAQADAKAWIERNRQDMTDMGSKLVAAGFRQETADQPYQGCGSYTYAGKRDGTGKDIIASFVVCPNHPPVALISTMLPIEKNPKGPLPTITPAKPDKGDK